MGYYLVGEACMIPNDPNHFAASDVKNSPASVADQLAFDALPDDVKQMVQRIYGDAPSAYTEDDLREAYEAGWEDCTDEIRYSHSSDWRWKQYLDGKKRRK